MHRRASQNDQKPLMQLSPNVGFCDGMPHNYSPSKFQRNTKRVGPDRFIPSRVRTGSVTVDTQYYDDQTQSLAALYGMSKSRVLEFQTESQNAIRSQHMKKNPLELCKPYIGEAPKISSRIVSQAPEKILDAPGIRDDFYSNVLSWSKKNQMAIGLDSSVYIYDANTLSAYSLHTFDEGYASSIKFNRGHHLSIAKNDGSVAIFDINTGQKLRTMSKHLINGEFDRVLSLAWNHNILSSGSEKGGIWQHDLRIAEHNIMKLQNHADSVCALSYRSEGSILASGSRDQTVKLWDPRMNTPSMTFSAHRAAIKALAWCPLQSNLLATGGGSNDRQIRFWNTSTGACVHSIDTGSQVSSIDWSKDAKELVSCHGLPNSNIIIWSYPTLQKIGVIKDNGGRIFDSCLSPDNQTLVTAADENLKFWKVFDPQSSSSSRSISPISFGSIR